ncbi:MAG: serine hydrolase [Gemmatimonadetes bacterium]|nr:serine hydrolase [Gemmatimonadota bacterium]
MRPHLSRAATRTPLLVTPLVALLAAGTPAASSAQATPQANLQALADSVFAPWNSTHSPGCAVGVSRAGRTLLERGYGMADLAGARAITPTTILESGSVAKQFTATAILLLAADGKLALDDDARKYLPELRDYGRTITVRHLLTHTSGLREWSNLVAWQGWPRGTRVHTNPDMVRLIAAQQGLNYPVGDHYSYTNSGFLLLHAIVERVSGMSFQRFTRERIFAPLGMRNTSWRDDFTRIVPGLAQAYARRGTGWAIDMPGDNVVGAGGLWTTVGDWLLWNEALTKKTLGANVVDSLTRRMRLTSGLEIAYALGVTVTRWRGTTEIAHSGSTAGYSTYLARYPELDNLSIAVMCNAAGAGATAYTRALVAGIAGSALTPVVPNDTVATDQAALRAWRGVYEDGWWHVVTRIDTARGVMSVNGTPIRALRDGTFLLGGVRTRLHVDDKGVRTLRSVTGDGDSVVDTWRAAEVVVPTPADLAAYAGRYRSDEIGNTVTVRVDNGRLYIDQREGRTLGATPTLRDAFEAGGSSLRFTRDAKGRVTALHVGEARMWDFVLTRLPDAPAASRAGARK